MWLNNFLCKRDLKKPNGSPLYTYQVSDSEFNELKIYLQSAVQYDKENYILPALFCLYCSEWYRRFYKGEWSWEPILKSLNIKLETNFRSYLVQNGLKYWNRQIIRYNNSHNSYLGSIFREGGLPYSLLVQEGSRFQELFRKILDLYYKNPQLILEQNSLLPFLNYFPEAFKEKTTLSLIIEMASNLISLVDKHDLAHLSDPIGYLEENLPDWRIKFPIPLTDETADKFMLGLFNSVVKEKKLRLKLNNKLTIKQYLSSLCNTEFRVSLDIPKSFSFIPSEEISPQRFTLYLYEGNRCLSEISSAYLNHSDSSDQERVEIKLRNTNLDVKRINYEMPLRLVITQQGMIIYQEPIIESELLIDDMPVILSDEEHPQVMGIGSVKKKKTSLHLMVNKSSTIELISPHSKIQQIDETSKYKHYRFSGEIVIIQNSEKFFISSLNDHIREEIKIVGHMLPYFTPSGNPIYLGRPKLSQKNDEFNLEILNNQYDNSIYGSNYARILDGEGNTVFKKKISILPPDFKVKLYNNRTPRNGIIEFSTSQSFTIENLSDGLSSQITPISDIGKKLHVISNSIPPSILKVRIRCNLSSSVDIELPFPSSGVLLLNKDQNEIPINETLSLKELLGCRLRFYPDINTATIYAIDIKNSLNNQKYWTYHINDKPVDINLYELRQEILSLLSSTGNLDEIIKVIISRNNIEIRQINIGLYSDNISIKNGTIEFHNTDIKLELLSLTTLETDSLILTEEGKYLLPNQIYSPSLIIPQKNSVLQSRAEFIPATHLIPIQEELQHAISLPPEQYQMGIQVVLDKMAKDINHPGWEYLDKLYSRFNYLPLPTFLVWKELIKNHEALAMFVVRHNETEKIMQILQDEYNVIWILIPISTWHDKLGKFKQKYLEFPSLILNELLKDKMDKIYYFSPSIKKENNKLPISIIHNSILPQWYQELNRRHFEKYWISEFSEELMEWIEVNHPALNFPLYSKAHQAVVYFPFFAAAVTTGKAKFNDLRDITDKDFYIFKSLIEFDPDWFKPVYLFSLEYFNQF